MNITRKYYGGPKTANQAACEQTYDNVIIGLSVKNMTATGNRIK